MKKDYKRFAKKIFKSHFFSIFFGLFYFLVFLNINSKSLFVLILISATILYFKIKDLKLVFWLLYLLTLPFEKGKSFSFTLIPAYLTEQKQFYNYWFTVTFADFCFLASTFFWLRNRITNGLTFRAKKRFVDILLIVFLSAAFLTVFNSNFPLVSFLSFLRISRMILAYFLVRYYFSKGLKIKQLSLLAFASSVYFESFWALGQFVLQRRLGRDIEQIGEFSSSFGYIATEGGQVLRASGTFVHPNTLAAFLSIFIPFFYSLWATGSKKITRINFLIILVLAVSALVTTGSRAAWFVAILVLIITTALYSQYGGYQLIKKIKKAGRLFFPILIILAPFLIIPRLIGLYQSFQKLGGAFYRWELIVRGLDTIKKRPLGIGLSVFPATLVEATKQFFSFPAPIHNLFLQVGVSLGILGLMVFLIFLILSYRQVYEELRVNKVKQIKLASLLGSISYLLLANFYPLFIVPNVSEYFWLLLGIMIY